MNGEVCCILGVCCPPQSAKQVNALAKEMMKDVGCSEAVAIQAATWVVKNFDLAPAGSLDVLRSTFVHHARKLPKEKE